MLGPDRPVFSHRPSAAPNANSAPLTPEQLLALRQFIARVGGLENARRALEMLIVLSRSAKGQ
jgi:hypothetical protein